MSKVIAIDFDETITDNTPYPITGVVRPKAKEYITKLYDKGYVLVLWTCRSGKYLTDAINVLSENDLLDKFTLINGDTMVRQIPSRKIVADFYIDDRSCMGEIDWDKIYEYIIENIK